MPAGRESPSARRTEDPTDRLAEALYDAGGAYLPPGELIDRSGLSGPALRRAVERLKGRGHTVEESPAHGLRLVRPAALDAHLLEQDLGTDRVGRNVICFTEVDSTNDTAAASARQHGADGLVVLADSQRRGRGRLGRSWIAPPAQNVLMSVVLLAGGEELACDRLTIAAGLATAEGIEDATGLPCGVKWPNDVLLDGAKLAGILIERRRPPGSATAAGTCWIVGIGINANAAPPPGQVTHPAACLADRLGHPVERTDLIRAVLRRLDAWLSDLDPAKLHTAWQRRCSLRNERVTVVHTGRRYTGRVLDISPLEGLVLSTDTQGEVRLPAHGSTLADA